MKSVIAQPWVPDQNKYTYFNTELSVVVNTPTEFYVIPTGNNSVLQKVKKTFCFFFVSVSVPIPYLDHYLFIFLNYNYAINGY
jgi:NADH:ubiquinone oxidoreductase subunit H